ncbi:MAG: acyltransferase [Bacteroidota bacterium]
MYIRQITVLRFIAAFSVVVFHFGLKVPLFDNGCLNALFSEGAIAVSFFFFLSGYVLSISTSSKAFLNAKEFYKKRIARIYPLYLIAFLMTLCLAMFYLEAFPKGNSIILQVLALHAWIPGKCLEINFPSWSISVEFFFYALFPLIWNLKRKIRNWFIPLVIIAWALSQWIYIELRWINADFPGTFNGEFLLYSPIFHLTTFLMGMLSADFYLKRKVKFSNWLGSLMFFVSCTLLVLILSTHNAIISYSHNGLLAPLFALLILSLSLVENRLSRFMGNRFFNLLGNSSYALYIFQWPLYLLFDQICNDYLSEEAFFVCYTLILILSSIVLHHYIEIPLKRKLLKGSNF